MRIRAACGAIVLCFIGAVVGCSSHRDDGSGVAGSGSRLTLGPPKTDVTPSADCEFHPPVGVFSPALEWSWTSSPVESNALNVMMTPAVADVNEDGVPDVVFASTASTGGGLVEVGFLRVLNGANGAELFTVTNPSYLVSTTSSVAVADIDGDGHLDIVACLFDGTHLVAFSNTGATKWVSDPLELVAWGAPSIANVTGSSGPEIAIGRQLLDGATGTLIWSGTGGRGSQAAGPLSIIADLDLDGTPEVIAGNTAYSSTGVTLWQNGAVPDGYTAVGNFDGDPNPEIVLVGLGQVYLLEHDGTLKWGPVTIPGGGAGGPPTIADYDADGFPEIGVAGASRYVVLETDGTLKWQAVTQDLSSNRTGSSVFDFESDGAAEVVYHDELKLRVYRGSDGSVLFEAPSSSCTWHEYPVIADVDGDGNAEIVSVANNNCGIGPQRGVFVYGDSLDRWVSTRKIWNEHAYHITNVNDDGSIPSVEANNWQQPGLNNYRTQKAPSGNPFLAPDVTASQLRSLCPNSTGIAAHVSNIGSNVAAAPVNLAFYDGDPASGGVLIGVAITSADLQPGQSQDVGLNLSLQGPHLICVVADDDGTGTGALSECNEDNNKFCATVNLSCNEPPAVSCRGADVCNDPGQCSSTLTCDGVASCVDPDGDATTLACVPPAPYALGSTAVAVVCSDGRGGTAAAGCGVTVRDCEPPACHAPPAMTFECNTAGGVNGSDPAVQAWLASASAGDNCGPVASFVQNAPGFFPLGTTLVTWTAVDATGNTSKCSSTLTVADTTPPVVSVDITNCCLWSPNHKFVDVGTYRATDVCDPGAGATATVAVTTDEPTSSAPGAGGQDHCPDAQVAGDKISLRSERSGPAGRDNGRVYDIKVTARDASGNLGTRLVNGGVCAGCPGAVCVPHDQNPKSPGQTPGNSPAGVCNAIDDGQIYDAFVCQ